MFYTYEQILSFYKIYEDPKYTDRFSFIMKMSEYEIDEEKACLIWQCFDMASERTWITLKGKK